MAKAKWTRSRAADDSPELLSDSVIDSGAPSTPFVQRLSQAFLKPAKPRAKYVEPPPAQTDEERRQRIRSVDPLERKWAYGGLALGFVTGVTLCLTRAASNPYTTQTVHGHHVRVSTAGTWLLYGLLIAVLAIGGLIANRYRKRSILTFCILILGFAFTLFFPPLGLALIVLGGWLLVRAWRVQRYGTPTAKGAAEISKTQPARPKGRWGFGRAAATNTTAQRRSTAKGTSGTKGTRSAPAANKRYTPKSPPKPTSKKRVPPSG